MGPEIAEYIAKGLCQAAIAIAVICLVVGGAIGALVVWLLL